MDGQGYDSGWIRIEFEPDDYRAFSRALGRSLRSSTDVALQVVAYLALLLGAVANSVSAKCIAVAVVAYGWYWARWRNRAAASFASKPAEEIRFSERGFESRSAIDDGRRRWSGYVDLIDTPDHLFLLESPTRAQTIPKRHLGSAEQQARLAALIRGWIDRDPELDVIPPDHAS